MRTERVFFFFVLLFLSACSLLAPPGDYGGDYAGEGSGDHAADRAADRNDASDGSSEEGG